LTGAGISLENIQPSWIMSSGKNKKKMRRKRRENLEKYKERGLIKEIWKFRLKANLGTY
jgi:hypothetical protein